MKSFKQMRVDGELVRADAEKIDYYSIYPEPGFNPVGRTDEEEDDDEQLYQFIVKNGVLALPQWEVRPREEGGVWIVDCHRRHKQTGRAIKAGFFKPDEKGRYLIPIKQFSGNDLARLYRIKTSNKSKTIKPVQFAELCQRAHLGFGQTVEQIAEGMQVSVSAVKVALVLAGANHDVQTMVAAGEVSATIAVKEVKKSGERAGPKLKAEHVKAKAMGKKKVTAGTIAPRPVVAPSDALDAARWRKLVLVADWGEVGALRKRFIGKTHQEFADALASFVDGFAS
jgi:ParB family chromosome partitioning protein